MLLKNRLWYSFVNKLSTEPYFSRNPLKLCKQHRINTPLHCLQVSIVHYFLFFRILLWNENVCCKCLYKLQTVCFSYFLDMQSYLRNWQRYDSYVFLCILAYRHHHHLRLTSLKNVFFLCICSPCSMPNSSWVLFSQPLFRVGQHKRLIYYAVEEAPLILNVRD